MCVCYFFFFLVKKISNSSSSSYPVTLCGSQFSRYTPLHKFAKYKLTFWCFFLLFIIPSSGTMNCDFEFHNCLLFPRERERRTETEKKKKKKVRLLLSTKSPSARLWIAVCLCVYFIFFCDLLPRQSTASPSRLTPPSQVSSG